MGVSYYTRIYGHKKDTNGQKLFYIDKYGHRYKDTGGYEDKYRNNLEYIWSMIH